MKNLINGMLLFCFMFSVTSCHHLFDDDDHVHPAPSNLPDVATDYINANYPDFFIESVELEDICSDSTVYEVELEDGPGPDRDLYFSLDGTFLFAEFDISVADLPDAVISTIEMEFPDYTINIDDVERLEMADGTTQYEVKLESNTDSKIEVVFDEDGNILCQDESGSDDGDDDDSGDDNSGDDNSGDDGNDSEINPNDLPDAILDYINANYSDYNLDSAEFEDLCDHTVVYEVELEDGPGPDIDLYFSLEGEFLFTAIEISVSDLPAAVMTAIEASYSDYQIDEDKIEHFRMADGSNRYEVEFESDSGSDIEVIFNEDGSTICTND